MARDTALETKVGIAFVGLALWLIALFSPVLLFLLPVLKSVMLACLLAFIVAVGIGTIVHQALKPVPLTESFTLALVGASAALAATILVVPSAGARPAWFVVLLVVVTAAVAGWVGLRVLQRETVSRLFAIALSGSLTIYAVAGLAQIAFVAKQAEEIAGDAPYCIQVSNGTAAYEPADTLLDLSGLTMRASGFNGWAFAFHAVLVVEQGSTPSLFNWSYRSRGWIKYVSGPIPVVHCRTQRHFAWQLPWFFAQGTSKAADTHLRFVDRTFVIPAAYQAQGRASNTPNLTFRANAPDFTPLDPPCRELRDCINQNVDIYFRPEQMTLSLTTQRAQIQQDEDGPDGRRVTRIYCWPPAYNAGFSCEHVFLREDLVYRFRHRESVLGQWQAMQDKLVSLVRSFRPALQQK
jgi:hypothetical protein